MHSDADAPSDAGERYAFATFTMPTPDGAFTVITSAYGVLASGWTPDFATLLPLVHQTLRPQPADVYALAPTELESSTVWPVAVEAQAAVTAYYAGDTSAPGRVPTIQASGPFREHAWEVLREVPPGSTVTYTEYAQRSGRPKAVRAAASACAMNAAALFVPCHRVLRSDGSLGGFRYGLAVKQSLLGREQA
ncbi:methylated-DNA-[protein]-cysteine S-methyltransferase [Leucobacter exalbidus]|uniref:Methylated-DNA-[protein]-cysteine S-methyltransferase n=1 Tax=Leucobacter exalbidus TaxID=662960 RepID=A0A940PTE3_9MICO|nr:methylated-DNA--[protein]-cysteine S-methyltransferase [Leucobacter exalbidus]MBP1325880.1 methylated-DNA-[protein]-cysteine S-methyltransferase [Leucobacter exalbidus]